MSSAAPSPIPVGGPAPTSAVQSVIRLTLPAQPENVALVRQVLDAVGGALGLARQLVEDARLAVTEACTNVVRHAYRELPGGGPLEVVIRPSRDAVSVVVSDFGSGIGPAHAGSGPGLGLPLITALADEVDIQHAPGAGSRVVMAFTDRERGSGGGGSDGARA
jgi:anti-sigma regulatory factor (Ser/Thr protein kinase)